MNNLQELNSLLTIEYKEENCWQHLSVSATNNVTNFSKDSYSKVRQLLISPI